MTDREGWPAVGNVEVRRLGRWDGVAGLALVGCAVGVFLRSPGVVLAAAVGLALAGYQRLATPPHPSVSIERGVDDRTVEPGDSVTVTLTVRNDGQQRLTDLRVVDGVPASAAVVDGAPACRTSLAPGDSTTQTYSVETDRGAAAFEPPLVATRDVGGVVERAERVAASGDAAVECAPAFEPVDHLPLRAQTALDAGRRTTDDSGSGVAFQVVRDHQPGDPRSRIAWRHWARSGELATVEFQPERAATVVLVVDTRPEAQVAPNPAEPTAIQRSVDAAARLFATLDAEGSRIGIATLDDERRWLSPGRGRSHRARAHDLLTDESLLSGSGDSFDPVDSAGWLVDLAPTRSQVIVLSPLVEDAIERFCVRLESLGVPVTVCSPDPTTTGSTGRRLARLERDRRLDRLREAGLAVVDWPRDQPLQRALQEGKR